MSPMPRGARPDPERRHGRSHARRTPAASPGAAAEPWEAGPTRSGNGRELDLEGVPHGPDDHGPPYTVRDTPDVVERIESDLADVLATVRHGDPHLKALLLTGGFARGEGAVLQGQPQNDYDFVAVRGLGRPKVPYATMAAALEARLGLHIDLAPMPLWRLRHVGPTIFWYETARRGRVLSGPRDILQRIPVQQSTDLDRREGLRLLANRAAGLLLVTPSKDPHAHRLQAAKALLAALDAHLLAQGLFAPSQTERMRFASNVLRHAPLRRQAPWIEWAYRFKVDPANAEPRDAQAAWKAARQAILTAVPVALRHAGLRSLDAYARGDGVADHLVYLRRARQVPAPAVLNPTGRVRVGTLRLLEASKDAVVHPADARAALGRLAGDGQDPVRLLDRLRHATLQ